jgi:hypothetical protein
LRVCEKISAAATGVPNSAPMVPEAARMVQSSELTRGNSESRRDGQGDIHHHDRMLRPEADAAGEAEYQRGEQAGQRAGAGGAN